MQQPCRRQGIICVAWRKDGSSCNIHTIRGVHAGGLSGSALGVSGCHSRAPGCCNARAVSNGLCGAVSLGQGAWVIFPSIASSVAILNRTHKSLGPKPACPPIPEPLNRTNSGKVLSSLGSISAAQSSFCCFLDLGSCGPRTRHCDRSGGCFLKPLLLLPQQLPGLCKP